ncbi:hypothetical protein ACVQ90_10100 [Staphylococcus aureus]
MVISDRYIEIESIEHELQDKRIGDSDKQAFKFLHLEEQEAIYVI